MEPMGAVLAKKSERIAWIANGIFFFGAVILVPFTLLARAMCIANRSSRAGWLSRSSGFGLVW